MKPTTSSNISAGGRGEWEVESRVGDETQTATMTIERHAPGFHALKFDGGGISLWGYDPLLKTWVGTGFNSDGSRFTDVLKPPASKVIQPSVVNKSQVEVWQIDGTKVTAESTWSYEDDDRVIIRQLLKTASGDALPSVVFACKRKKKNLSKTWKSP